MKTALLGLLLAAAAGAADPPFRIVAAVHALPDLPAGERAAAVSALLADPEATLEVLVAACRAIPPLPPLAPGPQEVPGGWLVPPAGYSTTRQWPLLIAVGGTGQSAEPTAKNWARLVAGHPMLVLCPEAPRLGEGWTFAEPDRQTILAALAWARRHLAVAWDRVFLAGFSRGGHAAWDVALRHPGPFAGAIPVAGGPRLAFTGDQNNFRFLENLRGLPVSALVGEKDDPILVWNVREAVARLRALGADAAIEVRPDQGHAVFPEPDALAAWLKDRARPAAPRRVTLLALGPARLAWLEILAAKPSFLRPLRPAFPAKEWERLDEDGRRRLVADFVIAATPRLEAEFDAPNRIIVAGRGVQRFALLAGPDTPFPDERSEVEVRVGTGRPQRRRLEPSRRTLLLEWARRPDPGALAWARLELAGP